MYIVMGCRVELRETILGCVGSSKWQAGLEDDELDNAKEMVYQISSEKARRGMRQQKTYASGEILSTMV